ncbi:hypothetical protein SO802_031048 [Lithocarpus litseifolius]|uniref:DUF7588 domain-containing protein n=1 Tax=Lithocarpus litseifolius TaxID=425828 RepID=A0AAW2BK24_9ROSI
MNRLFRSSFSTSYRSSLPKVPFEIPQDGILNSESYELSDIDLKLGDWNIPKVPTHQIYKSSWSLKKAFRTDYHVKTIEQVYSLNKEYETCYLLTPSTLLAHRKEGHNYLHIGLVQVGVKPLIREGLNCSILIALRDTYHISSSKSHPPPKRNLYLELQGVKSRSQVSTPCYIAKQDSVVNQDDDNYSQSTLSPSKSNIEQPEPLPRHQLMVIRKEFTPDLVALGKEFDSEENKVKREAYRANYTLEQKKEVLEKWQEFMKEIYSNVHFFEYFENHFEWHKKSCVITKTNWTKTDNKEVVRSSHPPLENITIKHHGHEVVATPFRFPSCEEKLVKKVIEQNNYTNQCLGVIGKQLDKIEEQIENKVILQIGNLSKPVPSLEKPLVKLLTTRQTSLKSKDKTTLEIVIQKLEELVKKELITSLSSKNPQLSVLDIHTASGSSSRTSSESEKEKEHLENQFRANNYLNGNRSHLEVIKLIVLGFTGKLLQWWYEDVFTTRVMHRSDCNSPFWKEKFINGLPRLFGEKVKETLCNPLGVIDCYNLTYGDISSTIRDEGMKMCRDMKIQSQARKSKAKYELGTFCTQYDLPLIAPSKRKSKRKDNSEKLSRERTASKYYRSQKYGHFKKDDFYKKGKKSRPIDQRVKHLENTSHQGNEKGPSFRNPSNEEDETVNPTIDMVQEEQPNQKFLETISRINFQK